MLKDTLLGLLTIDSKDLVLCDSDWPMDPLYLTDTKNGAVMGVFNLSDGEVDDTRKYSLHQKFLRT